MSTEQSPTCSWLRFGAARGSGQSAAEAAVSLWGTPSLRARPGGMTWDGGGGEVENWGAVSWTCC